LRSVLRPARDDSFSAVVLIAAVLVVCVLGVGVALALAGNAKTSTSNQAGPSAMSEPGQDAASVSRHAAIPGLLSEEPSGGLYILVYFTQCDSSSACCPQPFYYVPEKDVQMELASLMGGLPKKKLDLPLRFNENWARLGYSVVSDGVHWDVWSNGVLVSSMENDGDTWAVSDEVYVDAPELVGRIQALVRERLGIVPFEPKTVRGIVSARLDVQFAGAKEKYTQTVTDTAALADIEAMLSGAVPEDTGCPFAEAYMTLTLESGEEVLLAMASDSCCAFFVNGQIFNYKPARLRGKEDSGHNEMLFKYFDRIPMETRGALN